ncbi:MAG: hypothetical protein LBO77_07440 [Desulfovibrio sp.]|jgi:hypothetical protein|nr:hypothetical protein [Desulfovibrio sp.]
MNILLRLILIPALALAGCGPGSVLSRFSDERAVLVPHDPNSLRNLLLGREYAAAGRYELAKEQYLMALASSSDGQTRAIVTHELNAVDLIIQAQR